MKQPPSSPNTATQVAATVRAEMARRNTTARQLREHLGMSRSAMHRRLSAQHPFDVAELAAVAEFLGLPLSSLLGEQTAGAA